MSLSQYELIIFQRLRAQGKSAVRTERPNQYSPNTKH